jgi:hypothetical protein
MRVVRWIAVIAGAVAGGGVLAGPAWALGPSHANITFATSSTVNATATGVTASAVLVWTPGASDINGVGCCKSDITRTTTGDKLVEGTAQSRFPFLWNSDDSMRFQVDSVDNRGNYVGTAFTNAPSSVSWRPCPRRRQAWGTAGSRSPGHGGAARTTRCTPSGS